MTSLPKDFGKKVLSILRKTYPAAKCALKHRSALELLVATILSAQCTDVRVNLVTKTLFKKYRNVEDFARADLAELEECIRSTGFFRNKAKNIIACSRQMVDKFCGMVPDELEKLVALPGIGRKTANVILGTWFGIDSGVVVDTHVKRLAQRMGFSEETDPEKIEQDLMKVLDKKAWVDFSHLMIFHGRSRCNARKPDCENCELKKLCPRIGVAR